MGTKSPLCVGGVWLSLTTTILLNMLNGFGRLRA